ncbi:hypothetical protein [Sphingomonas sp.]|jgi:hypothetical protein|uniref:hypothetical protein n=1 Tax=Sphingomonas sp. TaxID=28214 RepID=UPI002DE7ADF6|nr:hypothetical protein [Sphingomonas sp.]
MLKKFLIAATLLAPLSLPSAPAVAQRNTNEQVLVIFGDDTCPRDTICVRRSEGERYRIPQELRRIEPSAQSNSWAARARSMEYVGASGTNSCTPSGAGGWTGCYAQMLRQAREERRARERGELPEGQ